MSGRIWSPASKAALKDVHPLLQELMILALERTPYDLRVVYGWRDEATQNRLFNAGASKLVYPRSMHNTWPAQAVDFNPIDPTTGDPDPRDWVKFRACIPEIKEVWDGIAARHKLPPTVKLECGAEWRSFPDAAHIQIMGLEGRARTGGLIRRGVVL